MSVRETIARNTIFNGMGRIWDAVVGLILIAYIVSKIGVAQYGLWAIVAAFTGYAALFDVGVGSAYAKYIAEHDTRGEKDAISGIVSTGFFFYVLFGGVFLLAAFPAVDGLLALIERMGTGAAGDLGGAAVQEDMRFLLRWALALFVITNCIAPFTAVQTGLQRMGVTNVLSVGASFVKIGATVYFLEAGHGVRGLIYSNALVLGAFGAGSVVAAFWLFRGLRVSPFRATRATFSKLFSFGWRAQVSRLSNLIMFETDVLVITFVLRDLQLAGLYKIGIELANKARQVPAVMLTALVPAASGLNAEGAQEALQRLYLRSTKYVAFVTVPLLVVLAGSGGLMMNAWQGAAIDLAVAVVVLRIMAVGYVANILPGPGVTIALGKGRPGIQMQAGLISMISNVVLTIALVYAIGFWGVPIATVVSMVLSWAWFMRAMGHELGVGPARLLSEAVRWPLIAAAPGFLVCVLSERMAQVYLTSRIESLGAIAAVVAVFTVLYLAMLRQTEFFDSEDLNFFDETLRMKRVPGYVAWSRAMREGRPL